MRALTFLFAALALAVGFATSADATNPNSKNKIAAAEQPATPDLWPPASKATGLPGGFYIGAGGADAISIADDVSSQGLLGKIDGGYDYRVDKFVIGIGAAYWLGETNSGLLSIKPDAEFFARVGYVLPMGGMIYAGGQAKHAEVTSAGTEDSMWGKGWRVGFEFPILSHLSFDVNFAETVYATKTLIGDDTKERVVGGTLRFRF